MPSLTKRSITMALAMALASQVVGAEVGDHEEEPDHAGHKTKVVAIGPRRLVPTVLVAPSTAAFGWLNYSSMDATIEFDEDITSKLTCRSPGLFRVSADNLTSPRVASGAFVTLCSLEQGEYDYRVQLAGRERPLLGKLVIEAAE